MLPPQHRRLRAARRPTGPRGLPRATTRSTSCNREIIDELTAFMKRRPDLIEPAIHLFSASRQIERIADHATNIAEDVIYLVQGEIVRAPRPAEIPAARISCPRARPPG